jgi:riboflavin synthase
MMFTGIVQHVGKISKIDGNKFTIEHAFGKSFEIGESVAINGACMTVLAHDSIKSSQQVETPRTSSCSRLARTELPASQNYPALAQKTGTFTVEMMEESRNRTVFGFSKEGDEVNLERSAIIGERNSGHNVTGHIDQVGEILKLEKMSDYWIFRIGMSKDNAKLIVEKGSVAIDGISLTVSDEGEYWFEVSILPYTMEETNLHTKKAGDKVNIEFDILGKYLLKNTCPPLSS